MEAVPSNGSRSGGTSWEESMTSTRALRRGRREIVDPFPNLTPMVDVLSVLMFFLLSIFAGGGFLTVLPEGLILPSSNVQTPLTRQVEVAVLTDRILVEREPVGDDLAAFAGNEELLLPELKAALDGYRVEESEGAKITIEADRRIPFRLLKKVMFTADQAGFHKQSLAVRQVSG